MGYCRWQTVDLADEDSSSNRARRGGNGLIVRTLDVIEPFDICFKQWWIPSG